MGWSARTSREERAEQKAMTSMKRLAFGPPHGFLRSAHASARVRLKNTHPCPPGAAREALVLGGG